MERDLSSILVSDNSTKEFAIQWEGADFKFKIKELPYVSISDLISKCVIIDKSGTRIDKAEYMISYLEKALMEAPWELSKTRMILKRAKSGFAMLIEANIQSPFGEEVDDLKKESSQ